MFFNWITLPAMSQSNGKWTGPVGSSNNRSSFVPKMLTRFLCVLCFIGVVTAFEPYVNNELDKSSSYKNYNGFSSANDDETVKRYWGISDSTALVGQIFNFTISKDAFTGKVHKFIVSEAGEPKLPSWLRFDQKTRSFQGIPLEKDVGQYYISVKAQGAPHGAIGKNVAKDVFSIDVVDDSPDTNNASPTPKCVTGEVLTVASVIFDADLENLTPESRINLLERAANVMKIPSESLKLKPLAPNTRAFDTSAIMAGPGNARTSKNPGAILQWQVGCSGVVSPDQSERITEIEKMSKDGTLGDELNHPVVGWHVTNRQQQAVVRREKRQAHGHHPISGTPVPTFFPTRFPHTTERVDEYTDETNAPESRIVPTMVSPHFSSSSHHHRHDHGRGMAPGERGHHRPRESVRITASPVLPRLATPYASIVGTPILDPDRPSTYMGTLTTLDIAPTRVSYGEYTPTISPSSTPILSVTDSIKPSKPDWSPDKATAAPPGGLNSKPTIQTRMKKLSIIAGKVWSYQIPQDTFVDLEDGDTRQLKLIFTTQDRTAITQSSWVQFDPVRQVLYALPLDENIGKYQFILEAMDSGGETINDILDIHVRQHPSHRAVHHTFTLSLVSPKWKYPVAIDWEIEVVKKLAKLYGDRNTSFITVKDVTTTDPLKITWTNDTLPRHPCPRERIERLANRIMRDETGTPTTHLTKVLGKEIKVDRAYVSYLGVCEASIPTTPITKSDNPPELRNAIEQVNATVGEILRFKVPEDTFYDEQDGSTRYLKLLFLTIDSALVPKSSWVQLNHKSQELYGLPFDGDVGHHEFIMTAQDNDGRTVNDAFMIVVHPRVPRKSAIEFSIHLDANFNDFSRNISQKVLVPWKLSKMYGDPDPRYITVNSISKGSVVFAWINNTLPLDPCPEEKIAYLVSFLKNDNETISSKLVQAMEPEFRVIKVDPMPLGPCISVVHVGGATISPITPTIPPIEESEPATSSDDDIYITTIIPAVVIAIMLIIAAMVACFLYRKKRKGKMTMNENGAFVTKGIPIIFADELDEKNDPAKPPIILKEEKPPLAPMDYPRSISASSRDSTPQTDRKEVANLRDTNADLHHQDPHFSPPYQPPPPFTTSRDNKNSRPKATPTYRQPPPYVPP